MMKVCFTIIIPVYNVEEYLTKMIDSILSQTYNNFELLLIDDGSKDNSGKICDEYSKKDKRVKVVYKENGGVSSARNLGIEKATGDYIMFFDADDYIENNYLENMINIINKYDVDFINSGFFSETYVNGKSKYDVICYTEKYYDSKAEIKKDLVALWDKHMLYNVWNKVYKTEIILKNNLRFPNFNFGEDMYFNKEYLCVINNFYNTSSCFYHYIKERSNSITNKFNPDLFKIRKDEYYDFVEYFKKLEYQENEYEEFVSRRFIDRCLGCIENICGSKLKSKEKKSMIKDILNDKLVRSKINKTRKNSLKTKILLWPIKVKSVGITYGLFNFVSNIRKKYPHIFNKLKNSR